MIYCKDENGNKFACAFPMYNIDYRHYILTVKEDGVYIYNVDEGFFSEKPIKRFQFSNKIIDIIGYEYKGIYHEYDEKEKLKPCPFCGGEASIDWDYHLYGAPVTYNVKCRRCIAKIEYPYDSEEEAVEAWNRRAELTDLELDEKLQKKYDEGFRDGQDYAVSVM